MSKEDNKEGVASENTTTDEKTLTYYEQCLERMNEQGLVVECPRCGASHEHIVNRWKQWVQAPVYATREKAWDTGATEYHLDAETELATWEDDADFDTMVFTCFSCKYTSQQDEDFIVDTSDSEMDALKVPVALTRLLPDGWREALQAAGLI